MICSAWDWTRLEYDLYECPGFESPGGWGPVTPGADYSKPPRNPIGFHVEDLLPPLPGGCRKVGTSVQAVGKVVRPVLAGGVGQVAVPVGTGWKVAAGLGLVALVAAAFGRRR